MILLHGASKKKMEEADDRSFDPLSRTLTYNASIPPDSLSIVFMVVSYF